MPTCIAKRRPYRSLELQLQRSADDLQKVQKKSELLEIERRGADEQRRGLEARQREARESIARLEQEQRAADEKLSQAQHRLGDAREALQALARRAAEAKAVVRDAGRARPARSMPMSRASRRATGTSSRASRRRRSAAADIERKSGRPQAADRGDACRCSIATGCGSKRCARTCARPKRRVTDLRQQADRIESRDARGPQGARSVHSESSELEVSRATEESRLAHLAQSCVDTLQMTLDEVVAEVHRRPRRSDSRTGAARSVPTFRSDQEERSKRKPRKAPSRRPSLPSPRRRHPRSTSHVCARRSIALARST